jgi:hypothetical protein
VRMESGRGGSRIVRVAKWFAIIVALVFAAIQFVRPARTNPQIVEGQAIENHVTVTPEVASILSRSCKDCHSHRTEWPWYTNVAPISWWITDHVNHGRSHLNFSEWSKLDDAEAGELLDEICSEVKREQMPLPSYLIAHRDATLSPSDRSTLCGWAETESQRIAERRNASRPTH